MAPTYKIVTPYRYLGFFHRSRWIESRPNMLTWSEHLSSVRTRIRSPMVYETSTSTTKLHTPRFVFIPKLITVTSTGSTCVISTSITIGIGDLIKILYSLGKQIPGFGDITLYVHYRPIMYTHKKRP